jgi:hypothetical protein
MHETNSLSQLLLVDGVTSRRQVVIIFKFLCYPKAHLPVLFTTEPYATSKTDLPPELSVNSPSELRMSVNNDLSLHSI